MCLIYYSSITEREGCWQKSDGYLLSNDSEKLQAEIDRRPKYTADLSWEYDPIESFETSKEKMELFLSKANDSILMIGDFDLDKYQ